jgi:hypothetical protein
MEIHFNTTNIVDDSKDISENLRFQELHSLPKCTLSRLDVYRTRVRRILVHPRTLSYSVQVEWEPSTPPEEILEVIVNAALGRGDGYERGGN